MVYPIFECLLNIRFSHINLKLAMKIILTGSSGFIGTQIAQKLLEYDHVVIGLDFAKPSDKLTASPNYQHIFTDLRKGVSSILHDLEVVLPQITVSDTSKETTEETIVIHLAAFIKVGESEEQPFHYYENNVFSTIYLLEAMQKLGIRKFIFASTAAVYGSQDDLDENFSVNEMAPCKPESVYGSTKLICETIIADYCRTHSMSALIFRFFNVAGAPEHGEPTHLIPIILHKIESKRPFTIFGTDYPTRDGTCVRDYIHVLDLANAMMLGMNYLRNNKKECQILNLGTSIGFTVKEVVEMCKKLCTSANKVATVATPTSNKEEQLEVIFGDKRPGDLIGLQANSSLAFSLLGWKTEYSLEDMVHDSIY